MTSQIILETKVFSASRHKGHLPCVKMLLRCPTSTEDLITACGVFDVPWSEKCLGPPLFGSGKEQITGLIAFTFNLYIYIYCI